MKKKTNLVEPSKPKVVVGVLVRNRDKYLLVKEQVEGGAVKWLIPGGKVEFGERLEQAARREIEEETGIQVRDVKLITFNEAVFPNVNYHTIIFFFEAETDQEKLGKDIEGKVMEAGWFTNEEIKKLSLIDSAEWLFERMNI